MTTGEALEIVWQIASATLSRPASARDQEALDIVEDLIVNEYGEDDERPEYESMTPEEYAEAICHTCGQRRSVCTGREGDAHA